MYQLIASVNLTSCAWAPPTEKGGIVWVRTMDAARHLLENGLCEWPIVAPRAGGECPISKPDGWPVDRFSVIRPAWAGETVVCIAGGPSVADIDLEAIRGKARFIAINNSYLIAPWADLLYFADYRWWEWHRDRPEFKSFAGAKVTIQGTGSLVPDTSTHLLHNYGTDGLSEVPNGLHTGCNSGYQAINIAYLAGARRIILLGYDMRFRNGRSHWHLGHPLRNPELHYEMYAKLFGSTRKQLDAAGIEVFNCCLDSHINAFPRRALAGLLPD